MEETSWTRKCLWDARKWQNQKCGRTFAWKLVADMETSCRKNISIIMGQ